VVALAVVAATAAACGGGSNASSSQSSSTSQPATTTTAANAARDNATASAINLTAADLPGWTASPNQTTAGDQAMSNQLALCAGAPNPTQTQVVDVNSPNFDQGSVEVNSDVTMVRSRSDALADLAAMRGSRLQGCVQSVVVPYIKSQLPSGAALNDLHITTSVPPNAPAESFAFDVTASVTGPQGSLPINTEAVGFLQGRAEVELDVTVTGGGSPDPTLVQKLLATLVSRAKQNSAQTA
jgi:hypothetical protein